ncbi:MAG: crossover junction endodeoxyribonuclease RuvC, partial [Candidatus Atribacteria bacterium]|nr:crossover junction endodeoxyribonuclease RuvC [Candidatus Atribacteria bacterium]
VHGMVAITVALMGLELYEYTPLQIKQATVGNGRAEKHQVQSMVKILLNLSEIPQPDHAADALAVAICHVHTKY